MVVSTSLKVIFLLMCLSISHVLTRFGIFSQSWIGLCWLVAVEKIFSSAKTSTNFAAHAIFPSVIYAPKTSKLRYLLPAVIFHRTDQTDQTYQTDQTNQTNTPKTSGTITEVGVCDCIPWRIQQRLWRRRKMVAKTLQHSLAGRRRRRGCEA